MTGRGRPQAKPSKALVIATIIFGVVPALFLDLAAGMMLVTGIRYGSPIPLIWGGLALLGTLGLLISPWRSQRCTTALLLVAGLIAMAPLLIGLLAGLDRLGSILPGFVVLGPVIVGVVHLVRFAKTIPGQAHEPPQPAPEEQESGRTLDPEQVSPIE